MHGSTLAMGALIKIESCETQQHGARVQFFGFGRRGFCVQGLAAQWKIFLFAFVGQKSEMPDTDIRWWHHVQQEPAYEFLDGDGEVFDLIIVAAVAVCKCDHAVFN